MMLQEAIVLAGGLGTRLQSVVHDVPKSMADINGRPFLEYLLDYLHASGMKRIVLATGFKGESIQTHFRNRYQDMEIVHAVEKEPLGTGGGIRNAFKEISSKEAFVFNGDSLFLVNLDMMYRFHISGKGFLTIALRYMEDATRYGSVVVDHLHRIKGYKEKGQYTGPGFINGGVYILNKGFLTGDFFPEKFSVEKDCFEDCYREVMMLGFPSDAYFLDIGIPADYRRAQDEFKRLEY